MKTNKTTRKQYKNLYIDNQTFDQLKKKNPKGVTFLISLISKGRVKLVKKDFLKKSENIYTEESLFISRDIELLLRVRTITNMETCFINTGTNDTLEITPMIELPEKGLERIKDYLKEN